MEAPSYANVSDVRSAADVAASPSADLHIARWLDTASRDLETMTGGRRFYPTEATRTFDLPDRAGVQGPELWLDENELAGPPTAVTVGGVAYTTYRLQPNDGPPYRWLEADESGIYQPLSAATSGWQDAVSITGPFGYGMDEDETTTLAAAIGTTVATTLDLATNATLDIGDAIRVDDERILVAGARWLDTGETLAADLALDSTAVTLTVGDTADYQLGETLLVGLERLRIVDLIGSTTLVVERDADGSVIAAHTAGATVYARRRLVVERGKLGTAAAVHSSGAVVYRHRPDPDARSYVIARALVDTANDGSRWARTVGSGDNEREARGAALARAEARVQARLCQRGQVIATGGPSARGGRLWPQM